MSGPFRITRAEFPQLAEFAAGYLHEDYRAEHSTPARARNAFLEVADHAERGQFARDVERFLELTASASWDDVREAWAALGGAWMPRDRRALERLLRAGREPR